MSEVCNSVVVEETNLGEFIFFGLEVYSHAGLGGVCEADAAAGLGHALGNADSDCGAGAVDAVNLDKASHGGDHAHHNRKAQTHATS